MAAFAAILSAAIGYFFAERYPLSLLAHFRVQSCAGIFLIAILLFILRCRKAAIIPAIAAAVLLWDILPHIHRSASQVDGPALRLVSYNVLTENNNYSGVKAYLLAQDADLIFLMEVNRRWVHELGDLGKVYPHQIILPREDNFGLAVFSRHPFIKKEILSFSDSYLPAVDLEILTYRIIGAHPLPPRNEYFSQERDKELFALANRISRNPSPSTIMLGDFNLTPFSPVFQKVLDVSGLHNAARGQGFHPTWMAHNPLFAIAIDHVLISKDLEVTRFATGPSLGSDHKPVLVSVRKQDAQPN